MTFHAEFTYAPDQREKLLRMLHNGGLKSDGELKINGAWISVQTGSGYAILETEDAATLYQLCSEWSDFGQVRLTPVLPAAHV
jgi:hypothetical protein